MRGLCDEGCGRHGLALPGRRTAAAGSKVASGSSHGRVEEGEWVDGGRLDLGRRWQDDAWRAEEAWGSLAGIMVVVLALSLGCVGDERLGAR